MCLGCTFSFYVIQINKYMRLDIFLSWHLFIVKFLLNEYDVIIETLQYVYIMLKEWMGLTYGWNDLD